MDANIFKHLASNSDQAFVKNIQNWWREQNPITIHVSVATVMEQKRGIEKLREKNSKEAEKLQKQLDDLISRLGKRILEISLPIAVEWGMLDKAEQKAQIDGAIAATLNLTGFYVVTRDEKDFFRKRNVRMLNPARNNPKHVEPQ